MFVAIHTGPITHLDHLAPLCFLLNIPLIVTDEEPMSLGKKFYPMVKFKKISLNDLSLEYMAKHFDAILTCGKFWALELKPLLAMLYGKEMRFIFSPHGNSDKEEFLDHPITQDIDLAYGNEKNGNQVLVMGNIRLWFYKEFQSHFDKIAKQFFPNEKKTLLYAPTWQTKACPTSFFEKIDEIIAKHSSSHHLLIKLHPLLEENDPAAFHRIMERFKGMVEFILNFPPVYPLLRKTDIYLGDFSSVGYDFLHYNRPMFFLKEGGNLQKCGELYQGSISGTQNHLSSLRKETYKKAFSSCEPEKIKALLMQGLEKG